MLVVFYPTRYHCLQRDLTAIFALRNNESRREGNVAPCPILVRPTTRTTTAACIGQLLPWQFYREQQLLAHWDLRVLWSCQALLSVFACGSSLILLAGDLRQNQTLALETMQTLEAQLSAIPNKLRGQCQEDTRVNCLTGCTRRHRCCSTLCAKQWVNISFTKL